METITKNRVTSSGNEAKALSTSDKTEKGSSHVDTSVYAAPVKMVKPNKTRVENLPLTPPDEKRSVSFDLHSNTTLQIPYDNIYTNSNGINGFANSPAESLDIAVRELSDDVCVSLMERHVEMKDLVDRNKDFFDKVKQIFFENEEESWNNFLKVLYSKREEKSDHKWMDEISEFLFNNPPFLATFKQIIGYYENDEDASDNADNDANNDANDVDIDANIIQDEYDYESCMMNDAGYIDTTPIRRFPMKLESLETKYPIFFKKAKQLLNQERQRRGSAGSALGGNHLSDDNPDLHPVDVQSEESTETPFDEFKRILTTPKSDMDDVEWETNIYECLDPFPELVDEFEYMICYEIPQDE